MCSFGVNHVGHFLLTMLLVDALKKGVPSRLVVVSSAGHTSGIQFFGIEISDMEQLLQEV